MSWRAGTKVTVRCPRCGSPVEVPVEMSKVDIVWNPYSKDYTVRTWFTEQINVDGHKCSDGLAPIDRFVTHGALDDAPLAAASPVEGEKP